MDSCVSLYEDLEKMSETNNIRKYERKFDRDEKCFYYEVEFEVPISGFIPEETQWLFEAHKLYPWDLNVTIKGYSKLFMVFEFSEDGQKKLVVNINREHGGDQIIMNMIEVRKIKVEVLE